MIVMREKYEDVKRVIKSDGQKTQLPTETEANNEIQDTTQTPLKTMFILDLRRYAYHRSAV